MATVKVPVVVDYAAAGGPGYNIFHARIEDMNTDVDEMLSALETFYTTLSSLWATTTTITIGTGMIQDPYGNPTYVNDDVRTVTGTGVALAMSPLLCINIGWRTASATRRGHGRTFLGPLVQGTQQNDGTPVNDVIDGVRGTAADLVADSLSANGWALGVYSQKDGLLRDFTGSSVRDRFTFLSSRRD